MSGHVSKEDLRRLKVLGFGGATSEGTACRNCITVPALPRPIGFGLTLFSMFEKVKFGCEQASNIYLFASK
jgi:hypothetical protein